MQELKDRKNRLLNTIRKEFSFLSNNLQFSETLNIENEASHKDSNYYFLRFTNHSVSRELEIILDKNSDYNLVTLKRTTSSLIPNYYDITNTIDVKNLDLFHSPNTFKYQNHIAYSEEDKTKYFKGIADKFQNEWLEYITGSKWFEREKIDELFVNKGFKGKSGFRKDKIISKILNVIKVLEENNYQIIENSNAKEPFRYIALGRLILHNKIKDVYIKFNLSYKDQMLSFEKKNAAHQSYRLLNFTQIDNSNNQVEIEVENIVKNWVNSEIQNGVI